MAKMQNMLLQPIWVEMIRDELRSIGKKANELLQISALNEKEIGVKGVDENGLQKLNGWNTASVPPANLV